MGIATRIPATVQESIPMTSWYSQPRSIQADSFITFLSDIIGEALGGFGRNCCGSGVASTLRVAISNGVPSHPASRNLSYSSAGFGSRNQNSSSLFTPRTSYITDETV